MIKLKTEVNKSAVMRELQAKAKKGFKNSWQPELQVQAYMNGVHDLFKLLRLGVVSNNEVAVCRFDTGSECNFNGECPYLCADFPKCSQQTDC